MRGSQHTHTHTRGSRADKTHLVLLGLLEDGGEPQVDGLGVVVARSVPERRLERLVRTVDVFEVQKREPNVELLLLLAEADRHERAPRDRACLVDLRELQQEGHILDPEV
jgi:hypothetical protein